MELSHFVLIVGKSEKGTNVRVRSFSKEEYAKKYAERYEEMHPDEHVSYGCSEIDNVTFMDIVTGENINYWGAMVDGKVTRLEYKYTTTPAKDCDFIQSNTKFDCIFIGTAEAGTDVTDDYIEKMYVDHMTNKEKTGKKSQQEMIEEVEREERKHVAATADESDSQNVMYYGVIRENENGLEYLTTKPTLSQSKPIIWIDREFAGINQGKDITPINILNSYFSQTEMDIAVQGLAGKDKELAGIKAQFDVPEPCDSANAERNDAIDKVVNDQRELMAKTDNAKNIMYYGEVDDDGTEVLCFKSQPTSIPTTSSIAWKQKSFAGICEKDAIPSTLDILNSYNSREDIEIDVPGGIGENKTVGKIKTLINGISVAEDPKDIDDGYMDDEDEEDTVPGNIHYTGYVSEDGSKIVNINMIPTTDAVCYTKWDGLHFEGVMDVFSTTKEAHQKILSSYKRNLEEAPVKIDEEKKNIYYDGYVSEDGLKVERVNKTPTDEYVYETKWSGRHFWGVCDHDIDYVEWANNLLITYGKNSGSGVNVCYRGWLNEEGTKIEKFSTELTTEDLCSISWNKNQFSGVCSTLEEAEQVKTDILALYKYRVTSYDQLTINEKKVVYDANNAYMNSVLVIKGNPTDIFDSESHAAGLVEIYNFTNKDDARTFATKCDKLNKDWIIMPIVSSTNNPMAFEMINGKNVHYKGRINTDINAITADYLDLFYTMSEADKFRYHISDHGKKFDFYGISEVNDKDSTNDIRRMITERALSTIEKIRIKDNFDKE